MSGSKLTSRSWQINIRKRHGRIAKTLVTACWLSSGVLLMLYVALRRSSAMVERDPELPDERRIRDRIGTNLGDVIVEEREI
jgi:hypothetical protein